MRSTIATDAADVVRAFYRDVLGGAEVCSTRADDADESLWFLVGSDLLEARVKARVDARDGDAPAPIVLAVDAPEAVAERCWDAGFLVHVHDDEGGRAALSVVDPLGRRIELSAAAIECSLSTAKSA